MKKEAKKVEKKEEKEKRISSSDTPLSSEQKENIGRVVDRAVREYGETFRKLGAE